MNDQNFIQNLVKELTPVKRLIPIKQRFSLWLIINLLITLVIMNFVTPLSSASFEKFKSPILVIDFLVYLATIITLSFAAFASIIPGAIADSKLNKFFIAPVFLYTYFVQKFLFVDVYFQELTHRSMCSLEIILYALIPIISGLYLIRKGDLHHKIKSITFTAISASLVPSMIMHFSCMHNQEHTLINHLLPSMMISTISIVVYFLVGKINSRQLNSQRE